MYFNKAKWSAFNTANGLPSLKHLKEFCHLVVNVPKTAEMASKFSQQHFDQVF